MRVSYLNPITGHDINTDLYAVGGLIFDEEDRGVAVGEIDAYWSCFVPEETYMPKDLIKRFVIESLKLTTINILNPVFGQCDVMKNYKIHKSLMFRSMSSLALIEEIFVMEKEEVIKFLRLKQMSKEELDRVLGLLAEDFELLRVNKLFYRNPKIAIVKGKDLRVFIDDFAKTDQDNYQSVIKYFSNRVAKELKNISVSDTPVLFLSVPGVTSYDEFAEGDEDKLIKNFLLAAAYRNFHFMETIWDKSESWDKEARNKTKQQALKLLSKYPAYLEAFQQIQNLTS
jgi:hypothetical protein